MVTIKNTEQNGKYKLYDTIETISSKIINNKCNKLETLFSTDVKTLSHDVKS